VACDGPARLSAPNGWWPRATPRAGSIPLRAVRVEHWDNATRRGRRRRAALLASPGTARSYAPIPFFWSDQYDCTLQLVGIPRPGDTMRVIEGALGEQRFVTLFERDNRATSAFLFNSMHRVAAYRQMVETAVTGLAEGATAMSAAGRPGRECAASGVSCHRARAHAACGFAGPRSSGNIAAVCSAECCLRTSVPTSSSSRRPRATDYARGPGCRVRRERASA
jgi:hypothetical protein